MNTIERSKPTKYLKLLLMLIPIAFTFLLSRALMGSTIDAMHVTVWQSALFIFSVVGLPLCFWFFKDFKNGGYSLAKSIGILATSLIIWTLTYLKIFKFSQIHIIVVMAALLTACLCIKSMRQNLLDKLNEDGVIEHMLIEELLFSAVLVILCFYKGMYPDINGQEKFMNYGFLNSMLRSDTLPANDMWLANEHINYYYYGQYVYSMITKFIGISPNYAYMIGMCTSIAIPFVSAYTIGYELINLARKQGAKIPYWGSFIGGILASFTTMIFGNSHSFFYDDKSVGNSFINFLGRHGVKVGTTTDFFYPDSTRYIGYNPDSYVFDAVKGEVISQGDYTIHEFPFYSYLVGDLHAHVISMMVVTLIAAFTIALVYRVNSPSSYERSICPLFDLNKKCVNSTAINKTSLIYEMKNLLCPEIIAVAILLGIATMTNYWDFLIYFIFCSMALLVFNTVRSRDFSTVISAVIFTADLVAILGVYVLFSEKVILHAVLQILLLAINFGLCCIAPSALSRTSLSMNFLFAVSNIIAIPFNLNFDMISNKIALAKNHSAIYQLMILWGIHFFISIAFIVYVIVTKNYVTNKKKQTVTNTPSNGYTNVIAKFFGERNLADIFVCGMAITGFLMIIAPEIIYVRDIYTSGYLRSNTMFKFTFAGFIILSLVIAYVIVRMFWFTNKNGDFSGIAFTFAIAFALLLFIPAHYTYLSLEQRSGSLEKSNFKTLDGTAYIETYQSISVTGNEGNLKDYKAAIDWFNAEVKGCPNIVEAYGASYTDCDMVSAYTGLPTIFGWQTHEWLWRYHGIVDKEKDILIADPERDVFELYINPRHTDVDTVYTNANPDEVLAVLKKYDVKYIVSGPIEFETYGYINNAVFDQIGTVVFESGYVRIYEVNE
ncbi:MAG: DUF2298 domain-containing protein [Clostridia bacterium]|nr:DUF2298 domain-containing protein [Clostridia bacterium]